MAETDITRESANNLAKITVVTADQLLTELNKLTGLSAKKLAKILTMECS